MIFPLMKWFLECLWNSLPGLMMPPPLPHFLPSAGLLQARATPPRRTAQRRNSCSRRRTAMLRPEGPKLSKIPLSEGSYKGTPACQSQALTKARPLGCIARGGEGGGLNSDCQLIFLDEKVQKAKTLPSLWFWVVLTNGAVGNRGWALLCTAHICCW